MTTFRKVTELIGEHKNLNPLTDNLLLEADGVTPMQFWWLDRLLPEEVRAREGAYGPRCRFRVTIEAELLEEKV